MYTIRRTEHMLKEDNFIQNINKNRTFANAQGSILDTNTCIKNIMKKLTGYVNIKQLKNFFRFIANSNIDDLWEMSNINQLFHFLINFVCSNKNIFTSIYWSVFCK